ncbi:MAG: gamma-glutamyl-gamma-aminobutyrate hydrolase family protein [Anaerolineales bacterium]|nr:gamma-glutamyl-gamma-aminobutyrate hydrolase family protein [Anaerolineales bacterium]
MAIPIIGITTNHVLSEHGLPAVLLLRAYVSAVVQAGGAPLLIPSDLPAAERKAVFERLDGVLFSGGGDIAVELAGGQEHPRLSGLDPARDNLELPLVRDAVESGKPFLGICRGFQVVNVALGGSLYTHLGDHRPGTLKHDYYPDWRRDHLAHEVRVEAGSRLAEILGMTSGLVNSLHHQGVDRIAPSLRQVAFADDGLVEGLELPDHPFGLAVQWHPEWLTERQEARSLFRAFVAAAGLMR